MLTQPIDESHRLALPNKLFEYMMAGVPVVASDLPAMAEVIKQSGCGVTVDPYDPRAIAKAIESFAPGTPVHEEARRKGLDAVRGTFNWTSEKHTLIALYASLDRRRQRAGQTRRIAIADAAEKQAVRENTER